MRETNSSRRFSTCSASIVPMVDIKMEIWRSSSSSSMPQILAPCCSPSASSSTAARSGPRNWTLGRGAAVAAVPARLASALVMSRRAVSLSAFIVDAVGHGCCRSGGGAFVEPLADDGNGLARILVGEFADLLYRLGVDLALDLGDVDHLRGRAWLAGACRRGLGGDRGMRRRRQFRRRRQPRRQGRRCARLSGVRCGVPAAAPPAAARRARARPSPPFRWRA